MREYIIRFLIAGILALCVSLLFLGGKHPQANGADSKEQTAKWIWPADGIISDTYGTRNGQHKGIDIAGAIGTPVYAVDGGIVVKSYYSDSYGNVIFIKHPNNLETVYAHLDKRSVLKGASVNRGDTIGQMGNTGDSSGVHLHFEIHQSEWTVDKQNAINPVTILGNAGIGHVVQVFNGHENENRAIEAAARPNAGEIASPAQTGTEKGQAVHLVKPGETLWSIAQKYHTTVEAIQAMNQLNSTAIAANQKLYVTNMKQNQYIVETGDTLAAISRKTNTTIQQIRKLNQLTTDVIQPKQILIVQKNK